MKKKRRYRKKNKSTPKGCAFVLFLLILAAGALALIHLMQSGNAPLPSLGSSSGTAEPQSSAPDITTDPPITFPNVGTKPQETDEDPLTTQVATLPDDTASLSTAITTEEPVTTASEETTHSEMSSTETPDTVPPETAPVLVNVTWEPEGLSANHTFNGETVYYSSINCPVFSGGADGATQRINQILRDFCRDYIKLTSEDKLLAEEAYEYARFDYEPYERSGDCTVYVRDGILSVHFRLFRRTGGADDTHEYRSYVFDLSSGDPVSFSQYIGRDPIFGRDYIVNVFSQLINLSPENYFSDAKEILPRTVSLESFYLTEEALVLYYNPGIIAPDAHGVISITVDYPSLGKD